MLHHHNSYGVAQLQDSSGARIVNISYGSSYTWDVRKVRWAPKRAPTGYRRLGMLETKLAVGGLAASLPVFTVAVTLEFESGSSAELVDVAAG